MAENDLRPPGTVVVALPTTASGRYISRSLHRIAPELRALAAAHDVVLVACLNGPDPDGHHRSSLTTALEELAAEAPGLGTHLLVRGPAGKNAALGELIGYARGIGAASFLVVDDDVLFEPGTLARNIDALVRADRERIVVVGARILAPTRPLRAFRRDARLPSALWAWWWQSVFRLPYEPASEFFLFTPGPCSALRVEDYPELPADDSGITDDAYINYWTVAQGGEILQPPGSVVYFNVACGYREWIGQQLRILAGVERTLALFPDHADRIREVFAWAYSHNKDARVRAHCRTPRRLLLLIFYRLAQQDLLRRYRGLRGTPGWGRAESTKDAEFES
ncbi:hypothetical protein KDL01_10855 [Actinospica durhamensis]|uniref:Glycosyltransferase n=1 Tax=Actinospica durhamensis TaxID=1508375 RepID=A0A941ENN0_9ACTN|nr:hypothetical protein [Actinospica durhamensis]MBR7833767.1 hypothetical protein [Actinospica durhamensis]